MLTFRYSVFLSGLVLVYLELTHFLWLLKSSCTWYSLHGAEKGAELKQHVNIYIMYIYCAGSIFRLLSVGWRNYHG